MEGRSNSRDKALNYKPPERDAFSPLTDLISSVYLFLNMQYTDRSDFNLCICILWEMCINSDKNMSVCIISFFLPLEP